MKFLSLTVFIGCINVVLTVGYVPHTQLHRQLFSKYRPPLACVSITSSNNEMDPLLIASLDDLDTSVNNAGAGRDDKSTEKNSISQLLRKGCRKLATLLIVPLLLGAGGLLSVRADDELAKFAAEGHKVGVDGQCFLKKCPLETSKCANDRNCLKGLSCLARCKGGSMCSTGCFAKFGSPRLDGLLQCSVEKNDCVRVPGKEKTGWEPDTLNDLPAIPLKTFKTSSMQGTWYKNLGLDSRYDCFDCQRNRFNLINDNTLGMEALFRIPRPNYPGYLQSRIEEELHLSDPKGSNPLATFQSEGQMFGLTFWENWYVLGDTRKTIINPQLGIISSALAAVSEVKPDLKLIYYTGHTLQGSYKGAFLYSRTHTLSPVDMEAAKKLIKQSGLDPMAFCKISNQCFIETDPKSMKGKLEAQKLKEYIEKQSIPFWYLGQNFFRATESIAGELADWFDDPAILSDWLVSQQVKMIQEQPFDFFPGSNR